MFVCFSPDGVAGVCRGIPLHEGPDQEAAQGGTPATGDPILSVHPAQGDGSFGCLPIALPSTWEGEARERVYGSCESAGKCCSSGETSRVPA